MRFLASRTSIVTIFALEIDKIRRNAKQRGNNLIETAIIVWFVTCTVLYKPDYKCWKVILVKLLFICKLSNMLMVLLYAAAAAGFWETHSLLITILEILLMSEPFTFFFFTIVFIRWKLSLLAH
jgi:hypothetical protein